MAHRYNNEDKTIEVIKDCKKCIHIAPCKFHAAMKELAKQPLMYSMNEYLEWNNVLLAFELHASCQFFERQYQTTKNTVVTLASDPEIIKELIYKEILSIKRNLILTKYPKEVDKDFFFAQPTVNISIPNNTITLVLKTTDKEIGHGTVVLEETYNITDIINQWTFQ